MFVSGRPFTDFLLLIPPIATRAHDSFCEAAMLATTTAFALPVGEIAAATRRSPYAPLARQSAMYVAHLAFGLSYTEIGQGFQRDRTTAAHACGVFEDWRDDPAFDQMLASLENACAKLRYQIAPKVRP